MMCDVEIRDDDKQNEGEEAFGCPAPPSLLFSVDCYDKEKEEEKKKKKEGRKEEKKEEEEEEEEEEEDGENCIVEVLECGYVRKAPLPAASVEELESKMGTPSGQYFVELMRKRLECVRDVQAKWLSRACNFKHKKYFATQSALKKFAEDALVSFEIAFGPRAMSSDCVQVRKQQRRKAKIPS